MTKREIKPLRDRQRRRERDADTETDKDTERAKDAERGNDVERDTDDVRQLLRAGDMQVCFQSIWLQLPNRLHHSSYC